MLIRTIFYTVAALLTLPAQAASTLLHCTMVDAAGLGSGGELEREGTPSSIGQLLWGDFIVDLSTGAVHQGAYKPRMYVVVQAGGTAGDAVLVPQTGYPVSAGAAATDLLRVRQWGPRPLFIAFDLDIVTTGVCEPIG